MDIWVLVYAFPVAVFLKMFQLVLHNWFRILGAYLGIPQKSSRKGWNCRLKSRRSLINILYNKRFDVNERQKKAWQNLRQIQHKDTKLDKFCESCFRIIYYTFSFTFGLAILVNRPWGFTLKECWTNFPNFEFDYAVWTQYVFSLAYYLLEIVRQLFFLEAKLDFWTTMTHHVATIVLLVLSWRVGSFNIGCIIITTYDGCDIFLDLFKAARYANMQKTFNVVSAMFVCYWFVLRMGIFPFWILRHMLFELMEVVPTFTGYYEINGFLLILQGLNCYWSYLIVKMIIKSVKVGEVEGDIRSDDEQENNV